MTKETIKILGKFEKRCSSQEGKGMKEGNAGGIYGKMTEFININS